MSYDLHIAFCFTKSLQANIHNNYNIHKLATVNKNKRLKLTEQDNTIYQFVKKSG